MFYKRQLISLPRRTSLIAVIAVIRVTACEHSALYRSFAEDLMQGP